MSGSTNQGETPTAYDVKAVHRWLNGFQDDDLKQIPIVPSGTRLNQGSTYVDLLAGDFTEITANAGMEAGPRNAFVAKSEVDYQIWNRLIGITNPERTGDADES